MTQMNDLPVGRRRDAVDERAPDGAEIRRLAGLAQGAVRSTVCEVLLPAGQVSRPLRHRTVEEVWYVLEGRGQVWRSPPAPHPEGTVLIAQAPPAVQAAPIEVGPGDTLVIPTGWAFQFAAGAIGPLRFLCHTTPPWPGAGETVSAEPGGLGRPTV
jgi:mannose-6-phosphate isomerase-like protein (cupin superfamily)